MPPGGSRGDGDLGAVSPAGVQGTEPPLGSLGAKPPRSWNIIAFCVMVKAFS